MPSPLVPSDLLRIILVSDPQIAPDGSAVYYRRSWQDEAANETYGAIHRVDRDGRDQDAKERQRADQRHEHTAQPPGRLAPKTLGRGGGREHK